MRLLFSIGDKDIIDLFGIILFAFITLLIDFLSLRFLVQRYEPQGSSQWILNLSFWV